MSGNEKGATIPLRPRADQNTTELSQAEREAAQQEVINKAPLRSTDAESTNQPAAATTTRKNKKQKPWREGFDLPVDALMQIAKKTSYTQPKELELRLNYILSEVNAQRGFGRKTFLNDLIVEALDEYTTRKLNELGHDVS